jgi:hypothetical protein
MIKSEKILSGNFGSGLVYVYIQKMRVLKYIPFLKVESTTNLEYDKAEIQYL